jgi:hypothetical protein
VRKVLAANSKLLAQMLAKHQRLQQQQQQQQRPEEVVAGSSSNTQPAAAVLLQYCLSDVAHLLQHSMTVNNKAAAELEDNHDAGVQQGQQQQQIPAAVVAALQQLHGLPLLPLASGELQTFYCSTASSSSGARQQSSRLGAAASHQSPGSVMITSNALEQQLMAELPDMLLHTGLDQSLQETLLQIANAGKDCLGCSNQLQPCAKSALAGIICPSYVCFL